MKSIRLILPGIGAIIALSLIFFSPILSAQDKSKPAQNSVKTAEAVCEISPADNITLATDIHVIYTVHLPGGSTLEPLNMPEKWGSWEIVSSEISQTQPSVWTLQAVLRPGKAGKQTIPSLPFFYKTDKGESACVEAKEIELDVVSNVDPKDANLNAMGSENALLKMRRSFIPYVIIITAAIIILVVIWSALKKRKPNYNAQVQTPQEWAMEQLQKLIKSGLAQQDVKRFYMELTGIVRKFIERTTMVNAPELTTEEFLHKISKGNVFSDVERIKLKLFLEQADMVKFARYEPGEAAVNAALHSAEAFICVENEETSTSETPLHSPQTTES